MSEETEAAPPLEPEEPTRKKRHLLPWLLAAPFLLVLWLLGLLAVLPWLLTPEYLARQIQSRGSEALGAPVSLRGFDYHPFSGLELVGLKVGAPEGYEAMVLELEGLTLRYQLLPLLRGQFVLDAFVIEEPRIVIEEVGGRRNLDVMLERLAGPASDEPEPEAESEISGSLSPIDLLLRRIEITNAGFELRGGGQFFHLHGLSVKLAGGLEDDQLELVLKVAMPAVREPPNVQVSLPAAPFDVDLGLGLSFSATVAGSAASGLALGQSGAGLRVAVDGLTFKTDSSLPPIDAYLAADVALSPEQDRVSLERLALSLVGKPVLGTRGELDGLFRGMEQALGPSGGAALATVLGVSTPKGPGRARLELSSLLLPLDALLPYLQFFMPTVVAGGEIELGPLLVSGTVAELMASAPSELDVPLVLREVSLHETELGARLGRVSGQLRLFRDPKSDDRPFQLTSTLVLDSLGFEAHRVGSLELGLDLMLERLSYPDLGFTELGLEARARGIVSPPAKLGRLDVSASVVGPDLLMAERSSPVPAQISVKTIAGDLSVDTGELTLTAAKIEDELSVELDRLLTPALRPIQLKNTLRLSSLEVPNHELKLAFLESSLDTTVDDPRHGQPLDIGAAMKLRLDGLSRPPLVSGDMNLDLKAEVKGQPLGGAEPLPAFTSLDVRLRLPKLKLASPDFGELETKAGLDLALRAQPTADRVDRMRFKFELDDLVQLEATGSASRISSSARRLELKLNMPPVSITKLLAKIPAGLADQIPVTEGSGEVKMSLFFKGPVPEADKIAQDVSKLPFVLDASIGLDAVDLVAPAHGVHLRGLDGALSAEARAGRLMLSSKLRLEEFARDDEKAPVVVSDIDALALVGFSGGRWALDLSTVLGTVEAPGQTAGPIRGAALEISAHHPLHGGVEIDRISVQATELGLKVDGRGRLERRLYGVLRPALSLSSSVDFDRLRKVVPDLPPISGRLGLDLELESPSDEELRLAGHLDLGGMSFEMLREEPKPLAVTVQNVEGRLPFSQTLRLSPPLPTQFDGSVGVLGDDLELRIQDLLLDLKQRSFLVVDCRDVLQVDPKVAGYEALRPYRTRQGARLTIEKIGYNEQSLDNLSFDILYGGGVLRLDRFALQLFEGDIFGSFALQLVGREAFRIRLQGGFTDLNMDVPFSRARGLEPISNPGEKEPYLMSGTMDLQLDSKSRSLNGSVDLTKLGAELFVRIIDAMDPNAENEQLQNTRSTLSTYMGLVGRDIVGVSLQGMKLDIKHNLLSMAFDWYRPWFDVHATSAGGLPWLPRLWLPATQLLFGTTIVSSVPEIKRYSLSPYLGQIDEVNRQLLAMMVRPVVTEGCEAQAPNLAGVER